jgi:pantetheine-phosphate adenylyltransferase
MKKRALFPGSFDPLTNGHVDLIQRALKTYDEILVGILENPRKKPFFTVEERVRMVRQTMGRDKRVKVASFNGLLVNFVRKHGNPVVMRGLRVLSDFEYEFQMAWMNRKLHAGYEVVFMLPDERHAYLSSSLVRELIRLGGSVKGFVPKVVENEIRRKTKGSR